MPTLTEPPPTERARRTPRPRRAEESEASPVVHNDGELVLGAGVTLGIVPEPVKLLTKPGAVLELGDQAHVDGGTTIAAFGRVRVGAGARIGARCLVLDDQTAAGIDIGDGACIEDEVTILAGATVAAGERVARGSVVRPRPPAAARPVRDAAPAAPTLDDVRAVVSAVLPASADAPADVDLRATAGWTSLAEVQLVVALEERFGVVLADGALARRRTLAEIAALVTRPAASAAIPSPEVAATGGQTKRSSRADRLAAEARALGAAFGWHRLCARMANLVPVWALGRVRGALLRAAGCRIAPTATFLGEVSIVGPAGAAALLEVGEGSIVAPRVTFGLDAPIVLGRNVSVSPGATLYTGTHAVGRRGRRMDPHVVAKPVVVEDGAWIGLNAVLLPGVRIGAGAIVSAGSVVTADVPPDTLVAGNPAVAERTLPR